MKGPSFMTRIKRQKLFHRLRGCGCTSYYIHSPWVDEINFCCFICVVVIGRSAAELWRHIDFSRWHYRVGNLLPGTVLWWHSFRKAEIHFHAKFPWDISIHGWDKTTFGFVKRTAAILQFYIRFDFYLCVVIGMLFCICLLIGRSTAELMTSYRFFKMTAIESEIYFRVLF